MNKVQYISIKKDQDITIACKKSEKQTSLLQYKGKFKPTDIHKCTQLYDQLKQCHN